MNIVDARQLTQAQGIDDDANLLIWKQTNGNMSRMPVGNIVSAITNSGELEAMSDSIEQNSSAIESLNGDVDTMSQQIADLNSRIGNVDVGTITFTRGGANPITYDGSTDITVPLGDSGSGSGSSIEITRVFYIDTILNGNLNEDCTTKIQSKIDELGASGGGTIIFGCRTYLVRYLVLPSKVRLVGNGMGVTILKKIRGITPKHALIYIPTYAILNEIRDMTLTGEMAKDDTYYDPNTDAFHLSYDDELAHGIMFEGITVDYIAGANAHQKMYTEGAVTTDYSQNYKYSWISHVAAMGFGGDGFHIEGSYDYSIYMDNCFAFANRGHGFYLNCSDDFFDTLQAEKNGLCGIYIVAGGSKFSNIKSIWNGFIGVDEVYSSEESNSLFGSGFMANNHKNWGIFANAARCDFVNVEVQDNYCGGILISGRNVTFNGLNVDSNGYGTLGSGAASRLGQYDLVRISNCNFLYAQMSIYAYRGKYCGRNALAIDYLRQSVLDLMIYQESANTVVFPQNNNNTIIGCDIRGRIINDNYNDLT